MCFTESVKLLHVFDIFSADLLLLKLFKGVYTDQRMVA